MSLPDSILGLVLFVALLAPGLVAIQTRPAKKPVAKPTALREIAGIIFRSVTSLAAAGLLMGIIRALLPNSTPDVGALVREPNSYLTQNYVHVTWWGGATLALACAAAWGWSRWSSSTTYARIAESKLVSKIKAESAIETVPAWWVLFKPNESEGVDRVMVDVTVSGDVVYSGELYTFSPEIDEHADRELTLIEPITRKDTAGNTEDVDASLFGISAREIKHIAVRWEAAADGNHAEQ